MANEQYEIYETGTAAALAELLTGKLNGGQTALAPNLTAGAAIGIMGGGPTDTAAWTYRACPGTDGPATIESIHGRTLVWNQLARLPFSDNQTVNGISFAATSDGAMTLVGTSTAVIYKQVFDSSGTAYQSVAGHKYLVKAVGSGTGFDSVRVYNNGGGVDTRVAGQNVPTIGTATDAKNFYVWIPADNTFDCTVTVQIFDLTAMFGSGNEPSTVAEFEALYPEPYYPYDAGSLLSVQMEGIETTGFNQIPSWEVGSIASSNGNDETSTTACRTDFIPIIPNMAYCLNGTGSLIGLRLYDANKAFLGASNNSGHQSLWVIEPTSLTLGSGKSASSARYIRFVNTSSTSGDGICFNLSDPVRDGEYEPYWQSERTIPAATYFPNGMRSAGTVHDELTSDAAVTRVGSVSPTGGVTYVSVSNDGTCTNARITINGLNGVSAGGITSDQFAGTTHAWAYIAIGEARLFADSIDIGLPLTVTNVTQANAWLAEHQPTFYYELATPTTQAIDPPLNLTYRVSDFGTERIMHTDPTAAPTLVVTYGSTADGIRDRALACIAPVENGLASANYGVGSYLIHDGKLCKVTTAIATGEAITIGTNVTATTVMAEVIALTQ